MGIKGLTKFVSDNCPRGIKNVEFSSLMGRVVAIDASMSLYQFMIAIRDAKSFGSLTNEEGDATSHINGMMSRVVRLLEHGIKPLYVFDGKPPTLKGGELAKRKQKREKAEAELEDAKERGDVEEIKKQMGRTVKVTQQHSEDVKRLLTLIGVPYVNAPCEAEAQCARLCRSGAVYGTGTEDADALTFGSTVLLRHLNFSEAKAKTQPILEFNLPIILEELKLTMEQFIDFCILCGCDYSDTIRGVGPGTAYKLILQHKTIEGVVQNLDNNKYQLPACFPYEEARKFFIDPEITPPDEVEIVWKDPDYDGIRQFLVAENNFSEQRVENLLARLKKAKTKSSQTRLESFFGATTTRASTDGPKPQAKGRGKRKASGAAGGPKKKPR